MAKLKIKKIGPFLRCRLKRRGKSDARASAPKLVEGYTEYYFTTFIDELMKSFNKSERFEFSKIQDELTELNEIINNFNNESKKIFQDASVDIRNINTRIARNGEEPETPLTKAKDKALKDERMHTERVAIDKIQEINAKGSQSENKAIRKIHDFTISFDEELAFCLEKLSIYWSSLYKEYEELDTGTDINADLAPKEVLMKMCKITNPADDFKVVSYVVIPSSDIENIKFN